LNIPFHIDRSDIASDVEYFHIDRSDIASDVEYFHIDRSDIASDVEYFCHQSSLAAVRAPGYILRGALPIERSQQLHHATPPSDLSAMCGAFNMKVRDIDPPPPHTHTRRRRYTADGWKLPEVVSFTGGMAEHVLQIPKLKSHLELCFLTANISVERGPSNAGLLGLVLGAVRHWSTHGWNGGAGSLVTSDVKRDQAHVLLSGGGGGGGWSGQ
jgi:hypothetical protein